MTEVTPVSANVDSVPSGTTHGVRPLDPAERALVGLEAFLSACGLGGGVYLAVLPVTAMPLGYLDGTWFHSWRWPGFALFFFVGVCPALAAMATLRRMRAALVGHVCVGLGLVAWVVLEAAWVVVSPPLQIVMGLVGLAILTLGILQLVRRQIPERTGADPGNRLRPQPPPST